MLICHCGHAQDVHAEGGQGYCYATSCLTCEAFRENVAASNAARQAVEDETKRELNGYEEPKGESA